MTSYYETTTGAEVEKIARRVWKQWRNKCISEDMKRDYPAVDSPIEWNNGTCYFCDAKVERTATGCNKCHMSFCD